MHRTRDENSMGFVIFWLTSDCKWFLSDVSHHINRCNNYNCNEYKYNFPYSVIYMLKFSWCVDIDYEFHVYRTREEKSITLVTLWLTSNCKWFPSDIWHHINRCCNLNFKEYKYNFPENIVLINDVIFPFTT